MIIHKILLKINKKIVFLSVLLSLLSINCYNKYKISADPVIEDGVDGAIYWIKVIYNYDTCIICDTAKDEIIIKCR